MRRLLFLLISLVGAAVHAAPDSELPSVLTLSDARAMAIRNHPRLAASQIQAVIAQEGVKVAEAAFLPTLQGYVTSVEAGNENTRILAGALNNPSVYDRTAGGFQLNQLITDFGHTYNMQAGSKLEARAENENIAATREQVLLGVDIAYFTALQAQAVLGVAKETLASQQLLSEQVEALAKNQLKSDLDVSFTMVALEQAKLVQQKAEGDQDAAQAVLAAALGLRVRHVFVLVATFQEEPPLAEASVLVDDALHHRPDLQKLRFERDAAGRYARAENESNYPSISAVGVIGDSPSHDSRVPEHYAAGGVTLSVPIFEGGLYAARQRQFELRARIADENLRDAEDNVVRDVQVAQSNYSTSAQRLRTTRQLVSAARQALELAQARYRAGSSSIVEISQAQLNATSAEIAQAEVTYDTLIQRSILNYQTGQL